MGYLFITDFIATVWIIIVIVTQLERIDHLSRATAVKTWQMF